MPAILHRLLLLGLLAIGILLALIVQSSPTVTPPAESPHRYLSTTKSLLHQGVHTQQDSQKIRVIALTEADLTAVANFALMRKHWRGYAHAVIHGTRLNLAGSIRLPFRPMDLYLNLKLVADDGYPQARIVRLRIGRLSMPAPLVSGVTWALRHLTALGRYVQIAEQLLYEVRIGDGRLRLVLNWDQDTVAKARALVTNVATQERMMVYHARLAEVLEPLAAKRYIGLGRLTQPLFALAEERSTQAGGEPVEENRALILVLGAYVNGRDLLREFGESGAIAPLPRRGVLLNRRIDMAQHFLGSAAIAISGHRALADVVGIAKEINDTHSGSGFSFTDLAADRAGAIFGKLAVHSDEAARRVQAILKMSNDESVYMPSIRDLPENLGPREFAERFGDIESEAFLSMKTQIEARIAACALYQ